MSADSTGRIFPLSALAVIVNPKDNVAVAKQNIEVGAKIDIGAGRIITVMGVVTPGHRFALRSIPVREFVLQYGEPIGTSLGINEGDPVSLSNMSNDVPIQRDLPEDLHTPAPEYFPESKRPTFLGYRRPDERVGTRNYVLVIPTSMCSSHEAQQIARTAEFTVFSSVKYPQVDGVVAIPHNKGCGFAEGPNTEILLRMLTNYAAHPNVGGVILVELGCERTNLSVVDNYFREHGVNLQKPFVSLSIQNLGGTEETIAHGVVEIELMLPAVNRTMREEVPISELVLGVKCGGSDGFSGLSANPTLGHAADLLVRNGGAVLMTEVPEFYGAEHLLAHRAKDAETGHAIYRMVDWYREVAEKAHVSLNENPSPGNIAGGLLNITIKSLGAIAKGGTTRIEGVTEYAQPPNGKGLQLMQGPGYDQESTPGLVAAGANVIVFTTGRGTTIGNAIAPVIKLASNTPLYEKMKRDIDLNAGDVLDGKETIEKAGARVFDFIGRVASGQVHAHAEELKHREFQIWGEQGVSI